MPRTKPLAQRSTGLYLVPHADGTTTVECCIARKKPKVAPRALPRVESCVCAKDFTGVCQEHFPEDHYSAWCLRFGPPPNQYPYPVPTSFKSFWCEPPPIPELGAPGLETPTIKTEEESHDPEPDPPMGVRCQECGYDMGPDSTRQLCGKTYCTGLGYDSDATEVCSEYAPVHPEVHEPAEQELPADDPSKLDPSVVRTIIELPNPCSELYPELPPYEWNVFYKPNSTKPARAIDLDRLTRNTADKVNHYFPWLNKAYPGWERLYQSYSQTKTISVADYIADVLYCLYGVLERDRIASA